MDHVAIRPTRKLAAAVSNVSSSAPRTSSGEAAAACQIFCLFSAARGDATPTFGRVKNDLVPFPAAVSTFAK